MTFATYLQNNIWYINSNVVYITNNYGATAVLKVLLHS